jgi:hypothetical protein
MRAPRQTFVLTTATKVAADRSVMQPTTNFTYVIKRTNMFHHVINYQHVSTPFAIIVGVALQKYKEYNNLPYGISGTTQCFNECFKH